MSSQLSKQLNPITTHPIILNHILRPSPNSLKWDSFLIKLQFSCSWYILHVSQQMWLLLSKGVLMCLIQYVNTGSTYMGNHGPLAGSDDAVAFYNLHTYECFLHSLASSKVILWPSKVHLSWSFPIFYRALDGLWNVQTEPRAASLMLRSMLKFRQGIFRWNCWASSMFPWMPDGDFAGRRP